MSVGADDPRRYSVRRVEIRRVRGANADAAAADVVATEEPLGIRLGYSRPDGSRAEEDVSITMRTPGHDEDLAVGFLFTEGIIHAHSEVQGVVPRGQPDAQGLINSVRVDLAPGVAVDFKRLERHFYTSSSCGVCGKASLDSVAVQGRFDLHGAPFKIAADTLGQLPSALATKQAVFEQTGGLHASGLFDATGTIVAAREDVGRHNALDKLIGDALLHDRVPLTGLGLVLSGRASFELMQKAKMAGCPLVAAVGAPSSLAVELAQQFGMTLVGFLKRDRFNVYSRPDRVT
ncbi:MAG TPA: formate dehydrogenase accessory sulfurtransferase FdhD [Gammaproteobacteria bacterium]|nr:formate dehydrogenase accessory sulfurtransferase FdhD [Gammaproteobacteria bacterium]